MHNGSKGNNGDLERGACDLFRKDIIKTACHLEALREMKDRIEKAMTYDIWYLSQLTGTEEIEVIKAVGSTGIKRAFNVDLAWLKKLGVEV